MGCKTLKFWILCGILVPTVRSCLTKSGKVETSLLIPSLFKYPLIPCGLDMKITNHLKNDTISSGSLSMISGAFLATSLPRNLTEGNSKTALFVGRTEYEDDTSLPYYQEKYCQNQNGNWTTGTVFLDIYEGFRPFANSAPVKAQIGIKFNAACKTRCNDWIELRIEPSRDSFERSYFMRDAATTVLNGIRESIDGSREKNVNFVMALRQGVGVGAIVENQDFLVSAKLEKETTGNRFMSVNIYSNPGDPLVVVEGNA